MSSHAISSGLKHTMIEPTIFALDDSQSNYDVIIQFYSAEVNSSLALFYNIFSSCRTYQRWMSLDMLIRIL